MHQLKNKYKLHFSNRQFLWSIGFGLVLLIASLVINFYASIYATERASNYVNDLVLNNIPVFNVDDLFVYGPLVLWTFFALIVFHEPKRLPFVLKSIALFVLIRSAFVTLTHLGPFPDQVTINYSSALTKTFFSAGDLFFSGHTGEPFLMALLFWENRRLRIIFIAAAIFFGAVVLMGHLHYSIDVLAAFFITYTIYHLATVFFKKDAELFQNS